jgi:hypothetical protein
MSNFLDQLDRVLSVGHKLYLRVSIDGVRKQGAYLRQGLNWDIFERNLFELRDFLKCFSTFGRAKCNIALNILNLTSVNNIIGYLHDNDLTVFEPHYNFVGKPEALTLSSVGRLITPAISLIENQDFGSFEFYKSHVLDLIRPIGHLEPNETALRDLKEYLLTQPHFSYEGFFAAFPNNDFIRKALQ